MVGYQRLTSASRNSPITIETIIDTVDEMIFTVNDTVGNHTNSTGDDEDDYIYDLNAALSYIPLEELIPVSIFYGLTLILGIVGNLLVIFSIARYRRMRNVTNIFLTSLATADLLLILLCVPVKVRHPSTYLCLSVCPSACLSVCLPVSCVTLCLDIYRARFKTIHTAVIGICTKKVCLHLQNVLCKLKRKRIML